MLERRKLYIIGTKLKEKKIAQINRINPKA